MRFIAYLLLALTALLTLPGLGERDFWPPDEARYGAIAQEMAHGDHISALRLNAEDYGDKPPGYFWLVRLAAYFRGGVDEWALRIPSVLAAMIFVLALGLTVGRATGAHAAFLAGLIPLATWSFAWQARMSQLDLLFAALVTAAAFDGFRAMEESRPKLLGRTGLWLGLAILAKGPLALLILVVLQLWWWLARPKREEGCKFGPSVLLMVALILLPSLLWLGLAIEEAGWAFVRDELFMRNVVDRAAKGLAHRQPWQFYFQRIPPALAPWLLFLPLLLWTSIRELLGQQGRRLAAFSCLWVVVFLGLQSVFPGKRSIYAFLFYAPIFGLTAQAMAAGVSDKAQPSARRYAYVLLGLIALFLCVLAGAFGAMAYSEGSAERFLNWSASLVSVDLQAEFARLKLAWPHGEGFSAFQADWRWAAVPTTLGAGLVVIDLIRRRLDLALDKAALTFAVLFLAILANLAPHLDEARSRRGFAEILSEQVGTAEVAIYRHLDEGILFYFGRPLLELDGDVDQISEELSKTEHTLAVRAAADLSLEEWLEVPQHRFLVVRQKDRAFFSPQIAGRSWTVAVSDRVGSDTEFEVLEFDARIPEENR